MAGASQPACRITDRSTHGAVAIEGSSNVFINGLRAHRVGDKWATHYYPPHTTPVLTKGSPTVFVNGIQLGRIQDPISCEAQVASGSPNVFVGDGA